MSTPVLGLALWLTLPSSPGYALYLAPWGSKGGGSAWGVAWMLSWSPRSLPSWSVQCPKDRASKGLTGPTC